MDVLHVVFSIGRLCESPSCYELSSYCHVCKCVCVVPSPPQDDACLAELSLALTISLDINTSKRQLQGLGMGVWSLHAELHEGLFHSELLQRIGGSAEDTAGQESPKEPLEADITGFPELRLNLQLPCPFGVNGPVTDSVYLDSPALPTVGTARNDTLALRGRERQLGKSCVTFSSFEVGSKGRAEILGFLG